jgi:hypothetical protein
VDGSGASSAAASRDAGEEHPPLTELEIEKLKFVSWLHHRHRDEIESENESSISPHAISQHDMSPPVNYGAVAEARELEELRVQ